MQLLFRAAQSPPCALREYLFSDFGIHVRNAEPEVAYHFAGSRNLWVISLGDEASIVWSLSLPEPEPKPERPKFSKFRLHARRSIVIELRDRGSTKSWEFKPLRLRSGDLEIKEL